jgi:hypothetical protein
MTLPGTILAHRKHLFLDTRQPTSRGVDFPNGGEGDVTSSFAIGEEADVDAVERREATGNEVKPTTTRGGDLR